MKILKNFSKTVSGLWSLIVGLKITGVEFFKPWLTVHYPRQEVINLGTYRGHIDLGASGQQPRASQVHHVLQVHGDLSIGLYPY